MLTDTKSLLFNIIPVISKVIDSLKTTVSDSIDTAVNAVDFSDLTNKVFPPMLKMADGLEATQTNMVQLLVQGDQLTVNLNQLIALSTSLTLSTNWLI
jgi:hypothetical protein